MAAGDGPPPRAAAAGPAAGALAVPPRGGASVRLREFRRADGPRFFALLKTEFPEEEQMLGMRPEGFETLLRRLYRADVRLLLGILRAFRRSPFHLYVIDDAGTIAGATLLSIAPRAGFVSTVVVAPEYRRRGLARQLIEAARLETVRRGRPYVVLRVLASNAPARALYASAGYTTLDHQTFVVHERPEALAGTPPASGVRPFGPSDGPAVAELANRDAPAAVREVLPVRARDLAGDRWADRLFEAQSAAWVVDRGRGAEAYLGATVSPLTEAAHLSNPIVGETVEPELASELVLTAGRWLAERRPARVATSVADGNVRGHAALLRAGFRDSMDDFTLYRPSG
jgi:ribosomal protein S18 acetylase RimI-like enzyme